MWPRPTTCICIYMAECRDTHKICCALQAGSRIRHRQHNKAMRCCQLSSIRFRIYRSWESFNPPVEFIFHNGSTQPGIRAPTCTHRRGHSGRRRCEIALQRHPCMRARTRAQGDKMSNSMARDVGRDAPACEHGRGRRGMRPAGQ